MTNCDNGKLLKRPAQSLDLNLIDNLWFELKKKVAITVLIQ